MSGQPPALALTWLSAFLDLAPEQHAAGLAFWEAVTGWPASPPRGDAAEFATLVPPDGDDHLRVQRLGVGPSRVHLDLHVADARASADLATEHGARVVAVPHATYVVLRSPGGLTFCLVEHRASRPARAARWHRPDGTVHHSVVDQVCLDLPRAAAPAETAFWAALLGWEQHPSPRHDELVALRPPASSRPPALQLLLQRLGEETGPVRAHLDLACEDRPAEEARHRALGARPVARRADWSVLLPPPAAGDDAYCLTDRRPRRT